MHIKKYFLGWLFLRRMLSQTEHLAYTTTDVTTYPLPIDISLRVLSPKRNSIGDVVLLYGLSLKGNSDVRIMKLARVIASLGFKVWLPQLAEITNHEIRLDVQVRVDSLLQALKRHISGPLAVMAPSYLGTVALTLAAAPQKYTKIDTLCCIGVFGNFNRFVEQVIVGDNVDPYGRGVFLKNKLRSENRFSAAIHQTLEQIFVNVQQQRDYMSGVDLQQLGPEDREALRPLTEPDQWRTIESQLRQQLSPKLTLPDCMKLIPTKVAFVHGEKDSLATVQELKPILSRFTQQNRRVAITATMEHGHYFYKLYQLPALIRLANTFSFFFRHAIGD